MENEIDMFKSRIYVLPPAHAGAGPFNIIVILGSIILHIQNMKKNHPFFKTQKNTRTLCNINKQQTRPSK